MSNRGGIYWLLAVGVCLGPRVESARGQLGWQFAATDWQEVVESPLIDVVDICTSNVSHTEIALAAARAGKHILCEKPLALNIADAEKMLAAARTVIEKMLA